MLVFEFVEIFTFEFVLFADFPVVGSASFVHRLVEARQKRIEIFSAFALIYLALYEHRLGHLLADAHYGIETRHRVLKDHRNLISAKLVELLLGNLHKILSVVDYLSAVFYRVACKYAHYGAVCDGFARTAFADDCQRFALVQIEADVAYGLNFSAVRLEAYFKVFNRKFNFSLVHISPPLLSSSD